MSENALGFLAACDYAFDNVPGRPLGVELLLALSGLRYVQLVSLPEAVDGHVPVVDANARDAMDAACVPPSLLPKASTLHAAVTP